MGFMERWVWYHLAGFALTVVLVLGLDPIDDMLGVNAGRIPVGIAIALGIGIMEWAALRRFGVGPTWVMYILVGFIAGFALLDQLQRAFFPKATDEVLIIGVFFASFIAAYLQYRSILRSIPGAGPRWLILYTLGWTIASIASMSVSLVTRFNLRSMGFIALPIALILILSGAPLMAWITGGYLRRIFERVPEMPEAEVGHDLI